MRAKERGHTHTAEGNTGEAQRLREGRRGKSFESWAIKECVCTQEG